MQYTEGLPYYVTLSYSVSNQLNNLLRIGLHKFSKHFGLNVNLLDTNLLHVC